MDLLLLFRVFQMKASFYCSAAKALSGAKNVVVRNATC